MRLTVKKDEILRVCWCVGAACMSWTRTRSRMKEECLARPGQDTGSYWSRYVMTRPEYWRRRPNLLLLVARCNLHVRDRRAAWSRAATVLVLMSWHEGMLNVIRLKRHASCMATGLPRAKRLVLRSWLDGGGAGRFFNGLRAW